MINEPTTTKLTYMEDSYCFDNDACIIELRSLENGKLAILLDQTIFYPQGGGQPYDQGTISNTNGEFQVQEVRFDSGFVLHIGQFTKGGFTKGEEVSLHVDKDRRNLSCRLHSAGHLLDVAVKNVGLNLTPGKGYHFPDSPYVEYSGNISTETKESLIEKLETELNQLVTMNSPIKTEFIDTKRLQELCGSVPDYTPIDKPSRVVIVGNNTGCPCGGTHVKFTGEIGAVIITKIKSKGQNTRISYRLKA